MVYMTGSNLETDGGLASRDMREMLRAHDDPENVSVIVMIGGSKEWHRGYPSDRSVIYEFIDGEAVEVWSHDIMNMGDPDTLTTLLDFGYANYPAEDYALILWDHGGGPLYGVCSDELHFSGGDYDHLELTELASAFAASPCADEPLEWIGFDACLMACVETAFICAPYAKYMIASQEIEPGTGWDYSFLTNIAADPSGAVTGIRIVDAYYESFDGRYDDTYVTLSLVDLRRIGALEGAMDAMFYHLDSVLNENSFSIISNIRKDTRSIARTSTSSEYDLIDLYHMAQLYYDESPEDAEMLMKAVDSAVIYHRSNISDINGLSVYYPYYNKDYYKYLWEDEYDSIGFSKGYSKYLDDYADIWLSASLTSWSGIKASPMEPLPMLDSGSGIITMELTDEQRYNLAGAQLYVVTYNESMDLYSFAYTTDNVMVSGNVLSASYNNTALYILDENGRPLTGALEYSTIEDIYMLRAVLCSGDDMFDGDTLPVYIQFRRVPGEDRLEVAGVIDLSHDADIISGKQTVTLDPEIWKNIYIAQYPVHMTFGDDGELLPFTQWEDSDWVFADLFSNEQSWTACFVEENYVTDPFAAMFVVTDTQGNQYGSDLVPIENDNLQPLTVEPVTLIDNELMAAELTGAGYSVADYDPGLMLRLNITNRSDRTVRIYAKDFIAGDVVIDRNSAVADNVLPGETVTATVMLYTDSLLSSGVREMPGLRFSLSMYDTAEFDIIGEYPVDACQGIDITPLLTGREMMPEPVSHPEEGILSAELFGVEVNEDGTVTGWLRYVNDTDKDYDTYVSDTIINGYVIHGVMPHSLWLPAGTTAYTRVTIEPVVEPDMYYLNSLPQLTEPFAYWGIGSIESLRTMVYDADYEYDYVDVYLSEPIPVGTGSAVVHADENLYSDSGISIIRRGEITCDGDYINVLLVVGNDTESPVSIQVLDSSVNSNNGYASANTESGPGLSLNSTLEIPAGAATRCMLGFDISDMEPGTAIDELSFTISYPADGGERTGTVTVTLPEGTTPESLTAQ